MPEFFDVDLRVERIKENRVHMQILSSPHPGGGHFLPQESADMSRIINDGIAAAIKRYPNHSGFGYAAAHRHQISFTGA